MNSHRVREEWEFALSLDRVNWIRPVYWETPLPTDSARGLPPAALRPAEFQRLSLLRESLAEEEITAPSAAPQRGRFPQAAAGSAAPSWRSKSRRPATAALVGSAKSPTSSPAARRLTRPANHNVRRKLPIRRARTGPIRNALPFWIKLSAPRRTRLPCSPNSNNAPRVSSPNFERVRGSANKYVGAAGRVGQRELCQAAADHRRAR